MKDDINWTDNSYLRHFLIPFISVVHSLCIQNFDYYFHRLLLMKNINNKKVVLSHNIVRIQIFTEFLLELRCMSTFDAIEQKKMYHFCSQSYPIVLGQSILTHYRLYLHNNFSLPIPHTTTREDNNLTSLINISFLSNHTNILLKISFYSITFN